MIQVCRSCGASPPSDSSRVAFVCEYCGTKNVDDQYFIERAKNIDASKADRYFGLGMVAFNSGDYQQAEKQFEQAVQEDDHNLDGWIYLAHTKAKTLKASNFGKHILVAINCIKKAKELDSNAEIVQFGSAAIANSFLAESIGASQYYFDTAEKKLVAYGKNGASAVASEAHSGFSLIRDAFSLNPNDSKLIATSSIYALYQTFRFDDLKINSQQLKKDNEYFFDVFYGIYLNHKEVALEVLAQSPRYKGRITTLLEKKDKSLPTHSKGTQDEHFQEFRESIGKGKKIFIGCIVAAILTTLLIMAGGKNETQKVPVSTSPLPAATSPKTSPQQAQQSSTDTTKCVDINSCIFASIQDVERGDFDGIRAAATIIEGLPKPDLGNRALSRKLNNQGLDSFKQENYSSAIQLFQAAMNENPRDVEVVGNLGFALLKNNQPKEAISVLNSALLLGPRRSATWTPLAESYALLDQDNFANAALVISYYWSNDREKSKKIYQDQLEKNIESSPKIAKLYETILKRIADTD
jgi:tetratricopeptide (TPR) repeat protein